MLRSKGAREHLALLLPALHLASEEQRGSHGKTMMDEAVSRGALAVAISNAVVGEVARTTGRGPTQAKTTLSANAVFVVLQDTLTRGEQTLVQAGDSHAVLDLRRRWQSAMRPSCTRKIEDLTGRTVIGFMSDNHIDPDVAVEVFILEPVNEDEPVG